MADPYAYWGGERAARLSDPNALNNAATGNTADLVNSIRAAGLAKKKTAYQTGLASAADRGVAVGSEPGGISGLAEQTIQPMVGDVEAQTEGNVMDAVNAERARLEEERQRLMSRSQEREAARPRGLLAKIGL